MSGSAVDARGAGNGASDSGSAAPATGETHLNTLLQSMSPDLHPATFVWSTTTSTTVPPDLEIRMLFREDEGLTIITTRESADKHGLAYTFPCRMITLRVHSGLDAVGFMAHITAALTRLGLGINPVSAYYHDHLFVPEGKEMEVLEVLREIAAEAKERS